MTAPLPALAPARRRRKVTVLPSAPAPVDTTALPTGGAVTILDALDDPNLFGGLGFEKPSWRPWRAFLAALWGLPLPDDTDDTFRACTGRKSPPAEAFAEAALIVGRRGGKSRVLALIAVYLATLKDYAPFLAPGEVATVAVLASTQKQARSIFRYVSGMLAAKPMLKALVADESGETITLKNRVVIEIATASFRTTRGYSFAAVLCDEIAFWRSDETSANPDVEILRALRPGMASIPGAILLMASSPYAKRGALYAAYRRHHGKDDARVLVWQAPTRTMNPGIDPRIIAEAYEDDPEAARAEYGAEFRDDLADFITRETVDAVTCWGRSELPREPGVIYRGFCDPSGGAADAMTLAIGHLRDGNIAVLDAALEVRPPFDPDEAVAACAALLGRYGITRVTGDRYAGQWPVARFAAHGIEFEQSARPKSDLYRDFLPLANARRIELLDLPRLASQLCGLERRTSRGGRDTIDHTPGGHDDLANAVAGVLVGLDLDRRPALVRPDSLLVHGAPVAALSRCDAVFAVLATGDDGWTAVAFMAWDRVECRVTLLDFDTPPMAPETLKAITTTVAELAVENRCAVPPLGIFAPDDVHRLVAAYGYELRKIPPERADVNAITISGAWHVNNGALKLSARVAEKAKTHPLGAALDFKAGISAAHSPLRAAVLMGLSLALDNAP